MPKLMVRTEVANAIPRSVAIAESVVPIRQIADTLILGISREPSSEIKGTLQFLLNRTIQFVVRSPEWVAAKLLEYYDQPGATNERSTGDPILWYWPGWHRWNGATLVVKASGVSNGVHWTGGEEFPPEHAEHQFWRWLIQIPQYDRLVCESEIPAIKRIWRRYCHRLAK